MQVHRTLRSVDIFFLVAGNMLGVGIFLTPNHIALQTGGALEYLVAWIFAGIGALSGGLTYAFLARYFPTNRGDFAYLREYLHPLAASLFFYAMFFFAFPGTFALLTDGFVTYFLEFFRTLGFTVALPKIWISLLLIVLMIFINRRKQFTPFLLQRIVMILSITILLVFLLVLLQKETLQENTVGWAVSEISLSRFSRATLGAYFSFIGFASVVYVSAEIREEGRKIIFSVLAAVVSILILYSFLNILYLKTVPWDEFCSPDWTVMKIVREFPSMVQLVFHIILMLAVLSTLNVVMITGSRLFEEIAEKENIFLKKLFPEKNRFDSSLISLGILAFFYLSTNTFGEILNTTTWVVLFFSFLTSAGFAGHLIRRKLSEIFSPIGIGIVFFTFFSSWIAITGMIVGFALFFRGIFYISLVFGGVHIISFLKRTIRTGNAEKKG